MSSVELVKSLRHFLTQKALKSHCGKYKTFRGHENLDMAEETEKQVVWPPGAADTVCPARVQESNFTGLYSWPC